MNPMFTWSIAETVARTTMEMLTRQCPKCRHEQVVQKENLREAVTLQEVRRASPAQRAGEVKIYAA